MARPNIRMLVETFYACRRAGEIDKLIAMLAPRPSAQIHGHPDMAMVAGSWEGHDACATALRTMVQDFEFTSIKIKRLLVDGESAAAHVDAEIRHVASGTTFRTELLDLFMFSDSKVADFTEFSDTAHVNAVVSGTLARTSVL